MIYSDDYKQSRQKTLYLLLGFSLLKLLIHLYTNGFAGYGIFRDEFYYLACSHRLAFGYVDQPPFSILWLTLQRLLIGDTVFALRFTPALAGALSIFFTGLTVRRMGGSYFAIILTSLTMLTAPVMLGVNANYSMNSLDILFWVIAAYLMVLLIQENKSRHWLLIGLLLGIGLLNKISVIWLIAGFGLSVLLTKKREDLKTPWPYLAVSIAIVLFLPFVIWNIQNDWAHLEFMQRALSQKYSGVTRWDLIAGQFLNIGPVNLIVAISGLMYYFFHKAGKNFRMLGIVFLSVFAILFLNGHSKPEYLTPAVPFLLTGGGIYIESLTSKKMLFILRVVLAILIVIPGIMFAPFAIPILPVDDFIQHSQNLGITHESAESKELAQLPQHYADMFGWENMARRTSEIYINLPDTLREGTVVYVQNYGEAASLEYFSRKYTLPMILAGHNNYWLWGNQTIHDGIKSFLIVGGKKEDHLRAFDIVDEAGRIQCTYCMPYENNLPVFFCTQLKSSIQDVWPYVKHYD